MFLKINDEQGTTLIPVQQYIINIGVDEVTFISTMGVMCHRVDGLAARKVILALKNIKCIAEIEANPLIEDDEVPF